MSKDFFEKPFDEDTTIKLEMYSDYLRKWIPVFLAKEIPFVFTINIFDFFAGVGYDSIDNPGSPILAIKALMEYPELLKRKDIVVNLYFNDCNENYCKRLNDNINQLDFDKSNIKIKILNKDFNIAFDELYPKMNKAANLIFLDQFGVKYIDKVFFQKLISITFTDILFFISSSTFKRFSQEESIKKIIGIDPEIVKETPSSQIHQLVTKTYNSFIPEEHSYCLAPFSIKKGSNIYGLIFGSGHPLGVEKFLEVCWKKDETTGTANFDIEGTGIDTNSPFLFAEMNVSKKIDYFQKELKDLILDGTLKSDLEIYVFMINNGFLGQHVKPIITELKKDNKITLKHPSFKCSTVWNTKKREPKKITLL